MYIKRLVLKNIRSYVFQDINLGYNSLMLSGDIGSGKSTILQAIEFALFGTKRKSLSTDSLLRHGEKHGSVTLTIVVDDKEIVIHRELKRGKSDIKQTSGYYIENGAKTEMTAIELKSKIIDLLNYPKDQLSKKDVIFRFTVYTPQEEMKKILSDDSESRLNTLRKVFDVEKYKLIRENIQLFLISIRQDLSKLSGQIVDLDKIQKEKSDKSIELKNLDLELKKHKTQLFEKTDLTLKIKQKLLVLENQVKENLEKTNRIKTIETLTQDVNRRVLQGQESISTIEKQISNLIIRRDNIKVNDFSQTLDEIKKTISNLEQDRSKIEGSKRDLELKLKVGQERIKAIVEDIDKAIPDEISKTTIQVKQLKQIISQKKKLELKLKDAEIQLQNLTKDKHKLDFSTKASKDIVSKISSLDECPTCFQTVKAEYKEGVVQKESLTINDNELELNKIQDLIKKQSDFIINTKEQIANINQNQALYERLNEKLSQLQIKQTKSEEKEDVLERLTQKTKKWQDDLDKLPIFDTSLLENAKELQLAIQKNQLLIQEVNNIKELIKLKESQKQDIIDSIMKSKQNLTNLDNERNSIIVEKNIEDQYKDVRAQYEKEKNIEKNIEIMITSLSTKHEALEEQLFNLTNQINEKMSIKNKIVKNKEYYNWLDTYFIELMLTIEKQVMQRAYYEFNEYFKNWFNILMEDETISVSLKSDFSVNIFQNGYDNSFDNLSGGEKTSCALAYRLALNKVINNINSNIKTKNIIILDEPTDGFSTEQLDRLRVVLEELGLKQIILVSHENKIESYVESVIKINKENHVSRIL